MCTKKNITKWFYKCLGINQRPYCCIFENDFGCISLSIMNHVNHQTWHERILPVVIGSFCLQMDHGRLLYTLTNETDIKQVRNITYRRIYRWTYVYDEWFLWIKDHSKLMLLNFFTFEISARWLSVDKPLWKYFFYTSRFFS